MQCFIRLLLDPEKLISAGRTGVNKFCCHGASWVVPILAFTWNVVSKTHNSIYFHFFKLKSYQFVDRHYNSMRTIQAITFLAPYDTLTLMFSSHYIPV